MTINSINPSVPPPSYNPAGLDNSGIPSYATRQRVLLVWTVALQAISFVPSLRLAGSFGTRSIALISSTMAISESSEGKTSFATAVQIAKTAVIGLGMLGVFVSARPIIIASLVADLGIQSFEAVHSAMQGEAHKCFINFSACVIDIFSIAAHTTELWELMTTASSISTAFFLVNGLITFIKPDEAKRKMTTGEIIDGICNIALSAIGIVSTILISQLSMRKVDTAEFRIKNEAIMNSENNTSLNTRYYNNNGEFLGESKPGETFAIELPYDQTNQGKITSNSYPTVHSATKFNYITEVTRQAIKPESFPQVFLASGTMTTVDELNVPA